MEAQAPSITVAVVGICGADHLVRCLDALAMQASAPAFDVVVVYDPHLPNVRALRARYPHVRMIAPAGQRSPIELASCALHEATGELVLLTEDHCEPRPDWVRRLAEALMPDCAAVGGIVEIDAGASAVDWAFYYVDFFRYAQPVAAGPSPTLTVCNVAYRRRFLETIRPLWQTGFHETAIHEALRERFGPLWITPDAAVRMRRHVRLADALYERYAFGRLFGCTRLGFTSPGRRVCYTVFAPALPLLLMGRMAWKARTHRRVLAAFLRAFPVLMALVCAWSWGEWLGYLTRRRPRSLVVAPER